MILEKDLSYKLQGVFIEVSKEFGCDFKEYFYHQACENVFRKKSIFYLSKPKMNIYSMDGKKAGWCVPDFIIEGKIIIEIKALKNLLEHSTDQLMKYLEKSHYEIGYLVNFGTSKAQIIRRIYTNDRKIWLFNENTNGSRMTRINH